MTTIAIANNKGGVAKTTTAGNLASELAKNANVLLIDIDPQGNLAEFFGLRADVYHPTQNKDGACISKLLTNKASIRESIVPADRAADDLPRPNLFLIPASRELEFTAEELLVSDFMNQRSRRANVSLDDILSHYLAQAAKVFDYVIIDCPPKLDTLKLAVYRFAQQVIVPVKTDYISVAGAVQHTQDLAQLRQAGDITADLLFIVPTMFDTRQVLAGQMLASLQQTYGRQRVTQPIPNSVRVKESPAAGGRSLFEYAPDSTPAQAYRDLVHKVQAVAS